MTFFISCLLASFVRDMRQLITSGEICTPYAPMGNYLFAPAVHLDQGEELTSNVFF